MVFKPYSHDQVLEILMARLSDLLLAAFDKKATEFVARKASNFAGDLRTALKLCQRTIELLREEVVAKTVDTEQWNKKRKKSKIDMTSDEKISGSGDGDGDRDSLSLHVVEESSVVMKMIKQAVEELKMNPFIATVTRCCLLDQTLLLLLCRYGPPASLFLHVYCSCTDLYFTSSVTPRLSHLSPPSPPLTLHSPHYPPSTTYLSTHLSIYIYVSLPLSPLFHVRHRRMTSGGDDITGTLIIIHALYTIHYTLYTIHYTLYTRH